MPYAVGTPRLVDRLGSFDLGLSAVGVTRARGRITEVAIDPCALRSIEARSVLLLRPLRNVSYLLNTVERARRYAFELGFELPREEEQLLWETYRALLPERQAKVLSNYAWAGGRDARIADHARHIGSGVLPPTA